MCVHVFCVACIFSLGGSGKFIDEFDTRTFELYLC